MPTASVRLAPLATAALGVLAATPGVHLAERWLAHTPAVLVSHGLGAALLAAAAVQWRARRRGPAGGPPATA